MKTLKFILAGGAGVAALAAAAPASAQYYPSYPGNYGSGYGYGQGGLGAVIEAILGGNRYRHGYDQRPLVERCIAAVNSRLERQYAGYRGSHPGAYGYDPYGRYQGAYGHSGAQARVIGVTNVDSRRSGLRVRGVATAGAQYGAQYGQYGQPYGYGQAYGYGAPQGELSFRCNVDYRGRILDIDIDRNRNAYYGYRR